MWADVPMSAPVPVALHGITWTTALVGLLNLLVGGGLVAWIKQRPAMAAIEQSTEERLRSDLIARVEKLEAKIDAERDRYERLIAIMRHRLNNSNQCLDALLLLLKTSPERGEEAIRMIEEMRARHREIEAIENASFHETNMMKAEAA
jgi:hypothetical protein